MSPMLSSLSLEIIAGIAVVTIVVVVYGDAYRCVVDDVDEDAYADVSVSGAAC